MELFVNIMGYCFIPFLLILLFNGFREIYLGLSEYYKFNSEKIMENSFTLKSYENLKNGVSPSLRVYI